MSKNDEKKETPAEHRETEVSGNAGLERTVGTSDVSTGKFERIGVAPAMPDTGSLDHAHTDRKADSNPSTNT
ncbi:unnamed protein product [Adineta ricciae]|uniref:Uncharacterized protein n=1 Tax=Adineta ricciae TaxID=249248 RepID=A0A815IJR1_ADIRI|nr:unnamed protein product [Adineta ricciae]CAF1683707.1 unnamed protein product [Adineta ricciae]